MESHDDSQNTRILLWKAGIQLCSCKIRVNDSLGIGLVHDKSSRNLMFSRFFFKIDPLPFSTSRPTNHEVLTEGPDGRPLISLGFTRINFTVEGSDDMFEGEFEVVTSLDNRGDIWTDHEDSERIDIVFSPKTVTVERRLIVP